MLLFDRRPGTNDPESSHNPKFGCGKIVPATTHQDVPMFGIEDMIFINNLCNVTIS